MVIFKDFPLSKCIVWVGNFIAPVPNSSSRNQNVIIQGSVCWSWLPLDVDFLERFFWGNGLGVVYTAWCMLCDVILYYIILYYIRLYYIILYYIVLYCIISYHIILYHIISYTYYIISYHIILWKIYIFYSSVVCVCLVVCIEWRCCIGLLQQYGIVAVVWFFAKYNDLTWPQ